MAIDYFTKWVEAELLSTIMAAVTQFIDQKFQGFLASYKVKHHFTSVEHLQANSQVEAANKVMFQGLKKRLDKAKGAWADDLDSVLWSYQTTPQSTTGEIPFKLTYVVDTLIVVEVEEPSSRVVFQSMSSQALRKEIDLANEANEMDTSRKKALKHQIANRYNTNIIP